MLRIAIEGASGYSGMELTRLMARHPDLELVAVGSSRWAGSSVRERLGLSGDVGDLVYGQAPDVEVDGVFLATPDEASLELAPRWREREAAVVDLSRAYRADPEAVYGLTEWRRDVLHGARFVANPGCYPTATQLALLPAVRAGLLGPGPIVIDAKSGATGAGRKNTDALLFNELMDNHYPYGVAAHGHVAEIELGLEREVLFTPHLLPTRRGLLVSAYAPVADGVGPEDLQRCLDDAYVGEPFVQVVTADAALGIAGVAGTPLCRVAVAPAIRSGMGRFFGSLDNLLKGAASQAMQNMNLALGLSETAGLL